MSDSSNILGAELEALLREAAADPRSNLLRAPRPTRVEGLLERQAVLRPSATELTALDRHLLAVHRAELADLLLRACTVLVSLDESIGLRVQWCRTLTEDIHVDSVGEWQERASSTPALETPGDGAREAMDLIQACVRSESGLGSASITQMATAALRLEPTSRGEAWVAFDQAHHGDRALAVRLVQQLLESNPRPGVASSSLETLGMLYAHAGRPKDAARAYATAFARDPERVTALVGWMHFSIQSGDPIGARESGRSLDDAVKSPRRTFLDLLHKYELQKRAGEFVVSNDSRQLARKLSASGGEISGKVIDVYL